MAFSIDDFGDDVASSSNPHCGKCPRCFQCGLRFRYFCQTDAHTEKMHHEVVLFDPRGKHPVSKTLEEAKSHSCGCVRCGEIFSIISFPCGEKRPLLETWRA